MARRRAMSKIFDSDRSVTAMRVCLGEGAGEARRRRGPEAARRRPRVSVKTPV